MEKLNLRELSVLIICRNQNMAFLVRAALKALGIGRVVVESDYETVMQLLAGSVIDMVFYDLDTGDGDSVGLDFVRRLRSEKESPHPFVPIILMSANTTPRTIGAARDAGIDEFMAKPVSAKVMYRYIVAVVTRRRDFIRTPNYFGPDRQRRIDDEYEGEDRRLLSASLSEAEAGQFEKDGGTKETLKFLD